MSDNLTNAAADANDALPSTEAPPEPVSVEIPAEPAPEGTPAPPAPEAAPAATEPPKKRGRPINERIQSLTADKGALMAELEAERRRSADLHASLQTKEAELTAGQARQMELHEARLKSDASNARQLFREARGQNDPDKEAEATALIARAESGLADVDAWKLRNGTPAPGAPPAAEPRQPAQQPQPPQQPAPVDPATAAWMSDNTWFQPLVNGRPNPDFNKVMHATAVAYAIRLEDQLRSGNRESEIGQDAYWEQINDKMAAEFPEMYEPGEAAPAPAPATRAASPVAPAVRSPAPGTRAPAPGNNIVQLSGAERQMADALREAGSLLYPASHPKVQANPQLRGARMTKDDAYIAYGRQLQRDKADQAQRRAAN